MGAYRQWFGRAPDVCLFSIGLSPELFRELDRMMVEAVETGVPVDERELRPGEILLHKLSGGFFAVPECGA
jgi:hypothetical protein